jgi:hypothetical protein
MIICFCFIVFIFGSIQVSVSVLFTASNEIFSNPERGFYKYSSTSSVSYRALDLRTLRQYREQQNITLIFRYFYLNNFKNTNVSKEYLTALEADFIVIRTAGIKCIPRFSYTDSTTEVPIDATKSIMEQHIEQFKPILIKNSDVIATVQIGFIGTWGEWYYTSQADFGGWGYNQKPLTQQNYNNRKDIVEKLLTALNGLRTVSIRYPDVKRKMYGTVPLTEINAFTQSSVALIGQHNDCFLADEYDMGTFTYNSIEEEKNYLEKETLFLPMGGETCKLYLPRSNCVTALKELKRFHWSYLNLDYHSDVLNAFRTQGCFSDIEKQLGYRFELISSEISVNQRQLNVFITIRNVGFAAPFNKRNAYIVLKNGNDVYELLLKSDPRKWFGNIEIRETLSLGTSLKTGTYAGYLYLPDLDPTLKSRPEYAIRFANIGTWQSTTGYNSLNTNIIL